MSTTTERPADQPATTTTTGATTPTIVSDGDNPLVTLATIQNLIVQLGEHLAVWKQRMSNELVSPTWQSDGRRALSRDVRTWLATLFDLCSTTEIEQAAWPLALEIDNLATAAAKLPIAADGAILAYPDGGDWDFWEHVRAVAELAKSGAKYRKPMETPESLVEQGLGAHEIARQYNWKNADGTPDYKRVREELDHPGLHFKREDFEHPEESRIRARWAARCAVLPDRSQPPPPSRRRHFSAPRFWRRRYANVRNELRPKKRCFGTGRLVKRRICQSTATT